MDKPNAIEAWQDAIYSGRYIDPTTEKNMKTTPPLKGPPIFKEPIKKKKSLPTWSWRQVLVIILCLSSMLFAGYFTYKFVKRPKTMSELQSAAIDRVREWASLNERIVYDFYNNDTITGGRYLCISEGAGKKCAVLGVRYVSPESDAGL